MKQSDADDWPDWDELLSRTSVSVDFPPRSESEFRLLYLDKLKASIPVFVQRAGKLPNLAVKEGAHVKLLREARQVFVFGYSYACVAMCGIAAERIVKDLLRARVRMAAGQNVATPSEAAFEQLERVEVSGLARFLNKAGALSERAAKAGAALGELRNKYAHARGQSPEADALQAIQLLHVIVEETVGISLDTEESAG